MKSLHRFLSEIELHEMSEFLKMLNPDFVEIEEYEQAGDIPESERINTYCIYLHGLHERTFLIGGKNIKNAKKIIYNYLKIN